VRRDELVTAVEYDRIRRVFVAPTDPLYASHQRSYLGPLRLDRAHDRSTGAGVVVAVLDTGVDLDHPDLAGRLVPGVDVVHGDAIAHDDHGHGTMVAGIVAANASNGTGIAGVAPKASIMPVKVLDADGAGSDSEIAQGIAWAVEHGADVVNLSLGGPLPNGVLDAAIADATARGVTVVAASGNDGSDLPNYPAAIPGVITVGATAHDGRAAFFSSRGDWLDLSAPGLNITSTVWNDTYATASGTSFAAPIVSGVMALVRARYPAETRAQVEARVLDAARDRGPHGIDPVYGRGAVDALAALGGPLPAPAPTFVAGTGEPDDQPDRARPVSIGATVRGELVPEGDRDWYSFTVGAAGSYLVRVDPDVPADLENEPRALDAVISLYRESLAPLARGDTTLLDEREDLLVWLPAAGTYFVRVENYLTSTSAGGYSFRVTSSSTPPPAVAPAALAARDADPWGPGSGWPASVVPTLRSHRPVLAGSVSDATVRLRDARTGALVAAGASLDADGHTVRAAPLVPLPAGPYLLEVGGLLDTGGIAIPADGVRFTVGAAPDQSPPATTITSAPSSPTTTASVVIAFTSELGTVFECSLDGGAYAPCTSPVSLTVAAGDHVFRVFARDPAGNEDPTPAVASWRYDLPSPSTTTTKPPPATSRSGYWMVDRTGHVYAFGAAHHHGNAPTSTAVDLEPTPSGKGYWVVDELGFVYTFGDAPYVGGAGGLAPGERVTSLSRTVSGRGYWLFTSRGRVFARGDASFFGDMSGVVLNGPVLDSIPTASGGGYYMVASDGGVFAFGDARFYGSMGGVALNAPVMSLVPDADGVGYWLVAYDGGIFAFRAPFRGSMGGTVLNRPVSGMVRFGNGYLMVGEDGGIFNFSDQPFLGSLGASPPPDPVVSVAGTT
jgi:type VII secretion-associated serine protease mycosin